MAAVLLQRWTAWRTATLTSQTTTSSPLQVLLPLRRMSLPRSCWTPVWSRSVQLVALWFALNLWQRQRPARRLSSSCVNLVLLYQRPAQMSWTNSFKRWCLFFYIIFFSTKYRQIGQCNKFFIEMVTKVESVMEMEQGRCGKWSDRAVMLCQLGL